MSLLDWFIVFILNGSIIAFGFYLARNTKSSSDWFLGGRSLPWWGLGLSIFATSVDNADAISLTGYAYNHGMHIITVYTIASVFGAIVAAFFYRACPLSRWFFYQRGISGNTLRKIDPNL